MRHRRAWIVGTASLAIVVALVAAGAYALARAPGWTAEAVTGVTGRETRVESVRIDWSWTPTVQLTGLTIANADWGEADHLLEARSLRIRLRIPPLLEGRFELPEVTVDGGALAIEQRADGEGNWSFSSNPAAAAAAEGAEPEEREEFPSIGRLRITDSTVTIRDAERALSLQGTVATATGEAGGADELELALKGRLAGKPLTVRFRGGSVLMLRTSEQPYPVDLGVEFAETRLELDGTFSDPVAFEGADVRMALSGPNLAEVFPLLGIPAPPSPHYSLEGRLQRDGEVWRFAGMSGRVGDSDLAGDVTVDYRPDTPRLAARLVSRRLRLGDLAPLAGIQLGDGKDQSSDQLFADEPMEVGGLHAMNMDVELTAERVEAPAFLPVDALHIRVRVENGRAEAAPLRFGVAGGSIEGVVAVNARSAVPSADADLTFRGLQLAEFFESTDFYDTMGGEIEGRLYLLGSGRSLAEVMGTATGNAALAMRGGAISGLLVEAAGVDLTEALILVVGEDARIPIRCAMARLAVEDGRASFDRGIMDTSDSVLYVSGGVDLRNQTVKLVIEAQAKDFSLLDIDAPVHIEGPIADPDFSLGKGAPIPFLELGQGEDVPCDEVIEEYLRPPGDR